MTDNALDAGRAPSNFEDYIAQAVYQRGMFAVMQTALAAWWKGSPIPDDLSDRLRADMGLPPDTRTRYWPEQSANPQVPPPVWRPGL